MTVANHSQSVANRPWPYLVACLATGLTGTLTALAAPAASRPDPVDALIRNGATLARQGNTDLAIENFERARAQASTDEKRTLIDGELGAAYTTAGRYGLAQQALKRAYDAGGPTKAARALDLGNLALQVRHSKEARGFFVEAEFLAGKDVVVRASARLNLARLLPPDARIAALRSIFGLLQDSPLRPSTAITRLLINAGHQAWQLGDDGRLVAGTILSAALDDARLTGDDRLQGEALIERALLLEAAGRNVDALATARGAATLIYALPPQEVTDLKIGVEFLQGRLLKASGNGSAALASYEQSAAAIESVIEQMPIEDEDGHSTYLSTIDPVTRGYVGLLLDQAMLSREATGEQSFLRRAIAAEENMHQAEMQDFMGDRCTVAAEQGNSAGPQIDKTTAIIYPLVLDDSVELLMRTASGITHRRIHVASHDVIATAQRFSAKLRAGEFGFITESKRLYSWLLGPLEKELSSQGIQNLVFAPDASLHVVPFAALWDGSHYAVENYAVSNITGITMTAMGERGKGSMQSLIAGVAEPGPVVTKLSASSVQGILAGRDAGVSDGIVESAARESDVPRPGGSVAGAGEAPGQTRGGMGEAERGVGEAERNVGDQERLKESLALPGVTEEVKALKSILPGQQMVDSAFTLKNFSESASSGDFGVVHIASHGFFGGSADSSYLIAYDDLLSMRELQSVLTSQKLRERPIDLLTLSACETAEGNARAPLGIAGAGIKARARSVVGTLWPVDDEAARIFMERFYKGVIDQKLSKTQAMRQAQLALLKTAETSHPTYWGPFMLIGNWQ